MKIAVLGTGRVGRSLAAKLHTAGHRVTIGTRNVETTRRDDSTDSFAAWANQHPPIELRTFREAVADADLILNAVHGAASMDALDAIGEDALAGKILLDLALPLDLSGGMPPTLTIANDDSLGERIQRAYPRTQVVKSLHTTFVDVMVDPGRLPGPTNLFVAGDDSQAKAVVTSLLGDLGWAADWVIDLGGIEGARATEMFSRLYFQLVSALGTFDLNIRVEHRAA